MRMLSWLTNSKSTQAKPIIFKIQARRGPINQHTD
jgi:hypothetical protein